MKVKNMKLTKEDKLHAIYTAIQQKRVDRASIDYDIERLELEACQIRETEI